MTKVIGNSASDGHTIGATTSDKRSFFGYTPVVQQAATNQSAVATSAITAVSTATPVTNGYGFSTTTQAQTIVTAINDLVTRVEAMRVLQHQTRAAQSRDRAADRAARGRIRRGRIRCRRIWRRCAATATTTAATGG